MFIIHSTLIKLCKNFQIPIKKRLLGLQSFIINRIIIFPKEAPFGHDIGIDSFLKRIAFIK
jgi:hypothetical protein